MTESVTTKTLTTKDAEIEWEFIWQIIEAYIKKYDVGGIRVDWDYVKNKNNGWVSYRNGLPVCIIE